MKLVIKDGLSGPRFMVIDKNHQEFRLLERDDKIIPITPSMKAVIMDRYSKEELVDMLIGFNR